MPDLQARLAEAPTYWPACAVDDVDMRSCQLEAEEDDSNREISVLERCKQRILAADMQQADLLSNKVLCSESGTGSEVVGATSYPEPNAHAPSAMPALSSTLPRRDIESAAAHEYSIVTAVVLRLVTKHLQVAAGVDASLTARSESGATNAAASLAANTEATFAIRAFVGRGRLASRCEPVDVCTLQGMCRVGSCSTPRVVDVELSLTKDIIAAFSGSSMALCIDLQARA
jgi:hypothetical protein